MPQKENLLGKKFNRLTVIQVLPSKNKKTYWLCKCDCGKICEVRADSLKSGKTKSCGCLNTETRQNLGKKNIQDITEQRFGKLVAIKRTNNRQSKSLGYDWICKCDCGNTIAVPITYLKSQQVLSCGCLKSSFGEKIISEILEYNKIPYEREKTFNDLLGKSNHPLRFDFYLPKQNIIIEFDGPQHYSITNFTSPLLKEYDNKKNKYCKDNKITLYRIPYIFLKNMSKTMKLKDLLQEQFKISA